METKKSKFIRKIEMTPTRFKKIGQAIYGKGWHQKMADDRAIAKSVRTIYRWAAGYPINPSVAEVLEQRYTKKLEKLS